MISPLRFCVSLTTLVCFLLADSSARADVPAAAAIKASGVSVINPAWQAALIAGSPKTATYGSVTATKDGVQLLTIAQPTYVYNLQATLLNEVPVKKGETLFIRFAARSLKADLATGVTKLRVSFGRNSPPWETSYIGEIGLSSNWQRFDIPFTAKHDFAPREAKFSFLYGYPAQNAELADVQFCSFGTAVTPDSLPKTRRFADPVTPAALSAEITRIANLRAELSAVADPSPAKGRTLHVSASGKSSGDGSASSPFASIQKALNSARPGDTVLVGDGEYQTGQGLKTPISGRPDAWIKLHAAPGARPKLISSGWSGIEIRSGTAYIEVRGFELEWVPDPADTTPIHGSGVAMMYATHHVRVLDNIVHGFGTGGIISLDCDYLHIEGNVIHDTAKTSPYGGSALSLCRAFDFDQGTGYRNVVRNNICYDNELKVIVLETSGGNGRTLTDGNGIIIDVFNRSRANPLKPHGQDRDGPLAPYTGRTLVENNLIHDNGGRGIHVFRSSHVDVVNNTTYMNQKSADINAGEFTAIEASHVTFLNNIAYGRKEKRGNSQDGSTRVTWSNNLFFNVADVLVHDGIIEADPLFAAPGLSAAPEGFRLQARSPALGKGLSAPAPASDLFKAPRRTPGPIDLGAIQSSRATASDARRSPDAAGK